MSSIDIPPWLKSLPLAPEYHPTLAEFQDPIAYILKIEKEASSFGICKIVPPLPPPPKKSSLSNLNHSFSSRNPDRVPSFTTRLQQLGFCPRRPRPVHKPVWQSGHVYTLPQFESKARSFEKSYLKHCKKPLEIESLFWRASVDKPLSVEYANDMPGSGFGPGRRGREDEARNVGETEWNMRGVSRAKGSLLRFMKEEIPGVTSPMVYVAMLFSWFAWHVEDHELHSLNYLHLGAGKTWYGVPRDAGVAFEEVVRMHGYGGDVNPLVTFATLGEKTTVMSPEVLVGAGIPCCRLVQNAGEFVVTFPGSYHTGFSHGFNCGEAANIATPGWLSFAKEAAIRRASINFPPMVSHFQLLYALALSLHSRLPTGGGSEPRSSRLKDKMKGEGEVMVKKAFVQNVIQNNHLLNVLLDEGSSCVVLPQNAREGPLCSDSFVRSSMKIKPRLSLGLCSEKETVEASKFLPSDDVLPRWSAGIKSLTGFVSQKGNSPFLNNGKMISSGSRTNLGSDDAACSSSGSQNAESEKEGALNGDGLLEQGLLSCVTCGILSFACVAVVRPSEAAAKFIMSADATFLSCHANCSKDTSPTITVNNNLKSGTLQVAKSFKDREDDDFAQLDEHSGQVSDHDTFRKGTSALDLLATAYGDSSDNEEDTRENSVYVAEDVKDSLSECPLWPSSHEVDVKAILLSMRESSQKIDIADNKHDVRSKFSGRHSTDSKKFVGSYCLEDSGDMTNSIAAAEKLICDPGDVKCKVRYGHHTSELSTTTKDMATTQSEKKQVNSDAMKPTVPAIPKSDRDSCRMHVFCLEHAVEVQKQLEPIGGVHMMLLCHPDYPNIEAAAKLMAKDLGIRYLWKNVRFREASHEDQVKIHTALEDEEVMPTNSDWTVKLGINLYYSASLSKSPIYNKQLPYNSVIYRSFGCNSDSISPVELPRRGGRHKKIVLAGRWCGKVWMSNQVHPYLANKIESDEEQTELNPEDSDLQTSVDDGEDDSNHGIQAISSKRNSSDCHLTYERSGKKRKNPYSVPKIEPKGQIEILNSEDSDLQTSVDYGDDDNNHGTQAMSSKRNSSGSMLTKRTGNKRKNPLTKSSSKKPLTKSSSKRARCAEVDVDCKVEDTIGNFTQSSFKMNLRSSRVSKKDKTSKRKLKHSDEAGESSSCPRKVNVEKGEPSSSMRKCSSKSVELNSKLSTKKQIKKKKARKSQAANSVKDEAEEYACDIDGCTMSFRSKHDLTMHKRDICPVKGCGKKFFSHKYLLQHRKVHIDDRPLVCPWKGCKMTFKWAWARTEHIRVHTGDRPYICREAGCGKTFRFVSDFSRHKRKTGHSVKKGRR